MGADSSSDPFHADRIGFDVDQIVEVKLTLRSSLQ